MNMRSDGVEWLKSFADSKEVAKAIRERGGLYWGPEAATHIEGLYECARLLRREVMRLRKEAKKHG